MRKFLAIAALIAAGLPGVGFAAPTPQAPPPAPPMQPPAQPGGGLYLQSDFVDAGLCIPTGRFQAGERVVFRAKVFDAQTNQLVPSAEVLVRFDDGLTIPMRFGSHPPPFIGPAEDDYWVAVWAIRPDAAPGVVRYTIEAVDGARSGFFEPIRYDQSRLTIVPAES